MPKMFAKAISATLITASVISLSAPAAHACWICDPIGETKKHLETLERD